MWTSPGPLQLCRLGGECITAHLTGRGYLIGDSPAAQAFHLRLVLGPALSLSAAGVAARSATVGAGLALLSAVALGLPQLLGTYALLPLHPLVLFASLLTFGMIVTHRLLRRQASAPTTYVV
jgi:hypothetical protein